MIVFIGLTLVLLTAVVTEAGWMDPDAALGAVGLAVLLVLAEAAREAAHAERPVWVPVPARPGPPRPVIRIRRVRRPPAPRPA